MKYSAAIVLASVAIGVQAQGQTSILAPAGAAPSGCATTGSGTYEVTVVKPSVAKRSLVERAECGGEGTLVIQVNNGIMTDSQGRIGSIVANRQWQFDGPPAQAGAIFTAGWSICSNNSIAIGPTTDFYQCVSGGFTNIYDQSIAAQCTPVRLNAIACGGASTSSGVSQQPDGQPTGLVSQQPDGQPTALPSVVTQISDGQPQFSSVPVVSQISDGQPQASQAANTTITTAAPSPTIATGGASSLIASGAAVVLGAAAMLLL